MIGCRNQVAILRQIVRREGCTAQKFGKEFRPILSRKRVEFVEQLLSGLGHEIRFARGVLRVKFVGESET